MKATVKRLEPSDPAVARLAPPANRQAAIVIGTQMAILVIGFVAVVTMLIVGQVLIAPVFLAVVIGLMIGPFADRIEAVGIPPWISGLALVAAFLMLIAGAATAFAAPLSGWVERLPAAWERMAPYVQAWKDLMRSVTVLTDALKETMGQSGSISVKVEDAAAMRTVAVAAPEIAAEFLLFLASLYFYIATRRKLRDAFLMLCFSRRARWQMARVFRDAEHLVSRYLLSITAINIGLAGVVAVVFGIAGVPSPLLWGMLAGVLNYVAYLGPAIMVVLLLGVGLIGGTDFISIITPSALFLGLHLVESQIVTPHVLGLTTTLNPFIIFLSLAFWIWIWGPVGGFVAVPFLLIAHVVVRRLLPDPEPARSRHKGRAGRAKSSPI